MTCKVQKKKIFKRAQKIVCIGRFFRGIGLYVQIKSGLNRNC